MCLQGPAQGRKAHTVNGAEVETVVDTQWNWSEFPQTAAPCFCDATSYVTQLSGPMVRVSTAGLRKHMGVQFWQVSVGLNQLLAPRVQLYSAAFQDSAVVFSQINNPDFLFELCMEMHAPNSRFIFTDLISFICDDRCDCF